MEMDRERDEDGVSLMEPLGLNELLWWEDEKDEGYLLCDFLSSPPTCSSASTQMMLCFGGLLGEAAGNEEELLMLDGIMQKSNDSLLPTLSSLHSSPPSSSTATKVTNFRSRSSKKVKKEAGGKGVSPAQAATRSKKPKTEASGRHKTTKVRMEKLGDRISALQQFVCPFGKTDTASVLHEALGYIRFLHEQIKVLSSPYLHGLPSPSVDLHEKAEGDGEVYRPSLRSRGLYLVPVSCTEHVAGCNCADFCAILNNSHNSKH